MSQKCTLIKTSDLEKLKSELENNSKLRSEDLEKKTEQLQNIISDKDVEIAVLRAQIKDMEDNPRIDPMKMEITVGTATYDKTAYDKTRNLDFASGGYPKYNIIKRESILYIDCVNFNLDENLLQKINKIKNLIYNRELFLTEQEIQRKANNLLFNIDNDFNNGPRNKLIKNIMNMSWLERRKFFKEFKKKYNVK